MSTPREIVAFKDIEYNRLNALKRLKGSQIYVYEQFPPEIEVKRRKLYPPLRQKKKRNKKRSKLVRDTLYIKGKEYVPAESAPTNAPVWNTLIDRNPKRGQASSTADPQK